MKKSVIRAMASADTFARHIHTEPNTPLNETQLTILFTLTAQADPLRPSELADLLNVGRPVVTKNAAALFAMNYIEKVPDTKDGRSFTFAVTRAGRALADGLLGKQYYANIDKLLAVMGKKKLNKLTRLLSEANAALRD